MKDKRYYFNWLIRLSSLLLAVFLGLGSPLPLWAARLFPALSPLNLLAQTLAQQGWYAGLFWTLPPLFFIVMACLKGRFFCQWVCPAGTLYKITSPRKLNMRITRTRYNGILFWIIISTSLIGLPSMLFLDPLPLFHRDLMSLRNPAGWAALIPGLIFPLFLLLGIFQPMIWCTHFCPAGYLFDLLRRLKRAPNTVPDAERRNFLTGLCIGLPLAAATTYLPRTQSEDNLPLLPPGAQPPPDFGAVCHRCYACTGVCPTGILRSAFNPQRPLVEWFQPEMNPLFGGCDPSCIRCSEVCPTGAIQKITLKEKRNLQVGIATIRQSACLSWNDNQPCMLCAENCPYNAITADFSSSDIARPVVNAQACRGCGYCQNVCPAARNGKAITVRPLRNAKIIAD